MSRANIEEVLHSFHTVSGMNISVLDRDFHTVYMIQSPDDTLCTEIHRNPKAIERCKAHDIEKLSIVKRELKPMLYTCPFGLAEAIVPILRDDVPIGYLFASLGVEKGKEYNILSKCSFCRAEKISLLIEKSCNRNENELASFFNILKIMADYLATDNSLTEGSKSIGALVKRYIKYNLSRKLTLPQIAKNLHCSTVTITEHFRREFGITINEYITRKRMELAQQLLLTTDMPLNQIASSSGFSDVEYFSRAFKKYHGESPARWRRKNKAVPTGTDV